MNSDLFLEWLKHFATAKIKLAENAFKTTGIEPFDPDVISDDLFAPSLVTDQPRDNPTNQLNMAADENETLKFFSTNRREPSVSTG